MRSAGRIGASAAVAVGVSCLLVATAAATELWRSKDDERSVALQTSLKVTGIAEYAPDAPLLYPERATGSALLRLRNTLQFDLGDNLTAELAHEIRARQLVNTTGRGAFGGLAMGSARAPYRLAQLDWSMAEIGHRLTLRQEIDRVFITSRWEWGELTVGRQAIGIGRGVMFSALDLFAPFAPEEPDREWRRGVDALQLEVRRTDLSSVGLIAVFGDRWEESALLGRWRGYRGRVDAELLFGKRGDDAVVGVAASAAVGDAAMHGELALFRTREDLPDGGALGDRRHALKAVAGASYTFDVGNGHTVIGEYHYSGFGLRDVDELAPGGLDAREMERFIARMMRGDSQILGRHALGVQLGYPVDDRSTASLLVLASPRDGSGLISPGVHWNVGSSASFRINAFIPWGEGPEGARLGSEYGATPMSLTAQLSIHF